MGQPYLGKPGSCDAFHTNVNFLGLGAQRLLSPKGWVCLLWSGSPWGLFLVPLPCGPKPHCPLPHVGMRGPEPGSLALFVSGAEGSILGRGIRASFPAGAPSLAGLPCREHGVCCPIAFGCLGIWGGDFANPHQCKPELTQLPLTRDLSLQDFLGAWHLLRTPRCPLPPTMRQRLGCVCKYHLPKRLQINTCKAIL